MFCDEFLDDEKIVPRDPVVKGHRQRERRAPISRGVIDENATPIGEPDTVDSCTGVIEIREQQGGPGSPVSLETEVAILPVRRVRKKARTTPGSISIRVG